MPLQFETISALHQASGVGPSVTVPAPAGLVAGELLAAIGMVDGEPAVITPPGGWTKHDEVSTPAFPTGFIATKKATAGDVAAGSFIFSQNLGGNEAWVIGIYRLSGALGFDSFKAQIVGGSSTTITEPGVTPTFADNVMILKAVQAKFATAGPTSITDAASQTRRAIVNVPAGPGDIFAVYYTDDHIITPPGNHSAHTPKGTYNGASGAKTTVHYAMGIAPLLGGGTPGELLRETVERGIPIKNPFGGRMRRNACMCIGKCNCS